MISYWLVSGGEAKRLFDKWLALGIRQQKQHYPGPPINIGMLLLGCRESRIIAAGEQIILATEHFVRTPVEGMKEISNIEYERIAA